MRAQSVCELEVARSQPLWSLHDDPVLGVRLDIGPCNLRKSAHPKREMDYDGMETIEAHEPLLGAKSEKSCSDQ